MNISRRAFALSGLGAASLAAVAPCARAQTRTGDLTLLVAQPAGGITDAFARAVAPALGHALGRVAVVENVTGASGSIAASKRLAAVPEGTTLFVGSPSETVLAPLTLRAVRYKPQDFRLLGLINDSPLALYARGDLPANDLDELVALARRAGDRTLSYGSTGQGSMFHLVTVRLLSTTGIQATHVPYRGGGPMLTDLQGGRIDFAILPVDALLASMVAGGRETRKPLRRRDTQHLHPAACDLRREQVGACHRPPEHLGRPAGTGRAGRTRQCAVAQGRRGGARHCGRAPGHRCRGGYRCGR